MNFNLIVYAFSPIDSLESKELSMPFFEIKKKEKKTCVRFDSL